MRRRAARERKFGVRRQPPSRGNRSHRTATDVVVASVRFALKQAIDESFLFGFRLVMLTALGLALVSAVVAFTVIENR